MQEAGEQPDINKGKPPEKAAGWRSAAFVLLVILVLAVVTGYLLDLTAISARGNWPGWLFLAAKQLTNLGKSGWILVTAAILLAIGLGLPRFSVSDRLKTGARQVAISAAYIFAAVALSGLTANLAKRLIGRARPEHFDGYGIFGFSPFSGAGFESFPSGHATTDGAFAAALAILFPHFRIPVLIVGAFLALTRVIVGAHYPSDVVAGFGFGVWFAILVADHFRSRGLALKIAKK